MTWLRWAALGVLTQAAAEPVRYDRCLSSASPKTRWELPAAWREVSGLALSEDGRLFIHGDETGRFAAIDAASGKLLATYELGSQSPRGDFEDIAIAGKDLYLITSAGRLYRTELPPRDHSGGALAYTVYETMASRWCEVEGLAFDPKEQVLLIGCKTMKKGLGDEPYVIRWSVGGQRLANPDHVVIKSVSPLSGRLNPSAIAIDPATGRLVVVSSADSKVIVADGRGTVLSTATLGKRHHQPEGLAISQTGTVFISDEGGKGPGIVTVYDCH